MTPREHPVYFGQVMLFKECREATQNQSLLSRAALILGACDMDAHVDLRDLVTRLTWPQYQAVLNVLALHANTAVRWNDKEQHELRLWARSNGDDASAMAAVPESEVV